MAYKDFMISMQLNAPIALRYSRRYQLDLSTLGSVTLFICFKDTSGVPIEAHCHLLIWLHTGRSAV